MFVRIVPTSFLHRRPQVLGSIGATTIVTRGGAVLMARIYEVFPLLCPLCGGQMRIIAFITHSADIRHILEHIGAQTKPPRITPARGPPLWDDGDAQAGEAVEPALDWDEAAQTAPDFEVDQRLSW